MGDSRGVFLKIVGRQHVVCGRDEGLKETPCPSRGQSQSVSVTAGHRQAASDERGLAGPARERRRDEPKHRKGQRQWPASLA